MLTIAKKILIKIAVALMAELVDAQVSGTCDRFGRGSSSLLQGTIKNPLFGDIFYDYPEKTELPEGSLTTSESETEVSRSAAADERSALEHCERWLLQGTIKIPFLGIFLWLFLVIASKCETIQ